MADKKDTKSKGKKLSETYRGQKEIKTYQTMPGGEVIDVTNLPSGGSPVIPPSTPQPKPAGAPPPSEEAGE